MSDRTISGRALSACLIARRMLRGCVKVGVRTTAEPREYAWLYWKEER